MKRAHAEQQRREQRRVQSYIDEEWDDPDNQPYSTDPAERAAAIRDEVVEGIPPAKDPAGAALKDAGLEEEVTTTELTPNPKDLGHAPARKQVSQPISASFW